ncbi:Alpha/Beta hydrolase protein [Mycena capillaripes]|nr:Alpha/Beta hydrolase protein [Mycena capillaripes]
MGLLPYLIVAAVINCAISAPYSSTLQVTTHTGTLYGFIDSSAPTVRQFLGVPFALPPTGPRRWLPPAVLTNSTSSINATRFSPSCPQIPLSASSTIDVFSPKQGGGNHTEFLPVEDFSEDCLTLNVWAPAKSPSAASLPVLVWFFGGGFLGGGANSLYFNPKQWVQRTQSHIVVSVNFRSNIFGFPNAAGLGEQNLGVLDQRASLEWLRVNIMAFGGDATRIVAWGESAGAIAIDFLHFAFPTDPIFYASILQSGTALFPPKSSISTDTAQANFAQVGAQLGCAPGASQLDCLRGIEWQDIEVLLSANASIPHFLPIPDERIVFANYRARYATGNVARVPALIGTNAHELNALVAQIPGAPFNATTDAQGNALFLCTAAETARLRQAQGLTTFRYRYDGNFPNISPPEFPGAYHASELPLLFGTAGQFHGASTEYEDVVGATMQVLWLDFVRDPAGGLEWGSFGKDNAVLLGDEDAPVKVIDVEELYAGCLQ